MHLKCQKIIKKGLNFTQKPYPLYLTPPPPMAYQLKKIIMLALGIFPSTRRIPSPPDAYPHSRTTPRPLFTKSE